MYNLIPMFQAGIVADLHHHLRDSEEEVVRVHVPIPGRVLDRVLETGDLHSCLVEGVDRVQVRGLVHHPHEVGIQIIGRLVQTTDVLLAIEVTGTAAVEVVALIPAFQRRAEGNTMIIRNQTIGTGDAVKSLPEVGQVKVQK